MEFRGDTKVYLVSDLASTLGCHSDERHFERGSDTYHENG
jgi:hypothetical protein